MHQNPSRLINPLAVLWFCLLTGCSKCPKPDPVTLQSAGKCIIQYTAHHLLLLIPPAALTHIKQTHLLHTGRFVVEITALMWLRQTGNQRSAGSELQEPESC